MNISMQTCKQYGISKQVQSVFAYSLTPNQLSYMFLTGNIDKEQSKSDYTDKLNEMSRNEINKIIRLYDMPHGISRGTRLFKKHGFVIKCDVQSGLTDRQSIAEYETYNKANDELKRGLAPILAIAKGRTGKGIEVKNSDGKVIDIIPTRRDDVKTSKYNNRNNTCRSGRYILSIQPYVNEVGLLDMTSDEVRTFKAKMNDLGIYDLHSDNIGRLNGKIVCIDYGYS